MQNFMFWWSYFNSSCDYMIKKYFPLCFTDFLVSSFPRNRKMELPANVAFVIQLIFIVALPDLTHQNSINSNIIS